MLAGLFDCYGYVPAEPEASARLALYPEKQWLRVVAHHCDGPGREMGGSADTHRTHGRDSRTGACRPLAVQERERRKRTGRMADFRT